MAASLVRSARHCLRTFPKPPPLISHSSSVSDNYDYKKTEVRVDMLGKEDEWLMYMESYSQIGFKLNSGVRIIGPCAVFPRSILHWNVRGPEDINERSLSLFTLLEPKLDIVVIGKGDYHAVVNPKVYQFLKSKRINVEILPTDQALATFNFLNSEKRYVAGAFIPPEYVQTYLDTEDVGIDGMMEQTNVFQASEYSYIDEEKHNDLKELQSHYKETKERFLGEKPKESLTNEEDKSGHGSKS